MLSPQQEAHRTRTPLFGIAQFDRIRVFINVPQTAASDTVAGTPAKVFTTDDSPQIFDGSVTRTSNPMDPKARTLKG